MWDAEWYRVLWDCTGQILALRAEKKYESQLPDHSDEVEQYARLWVEHDGYGKMSLAAFIRKMTDEWE